MVDLVNRLNGRDRKPGLKAWRQRMKEEAKRGYVLNERGHVPSNSVAMMPKGMARVDGKQAVAREHVPVSMVTFNYSGRYKV